MRNVFSPYRPQGLGATTTATLTDIQAGVNLVSNVQDKAGTTQTTNKTLDDISKGAATVATIAAIIPGGQVVALVAGIVSVAAKVLSGVFGGGPTTEQQLRSLNNTNDDLRAQIQTIDDQIKKVTDGLNSMLSSLKANGFNVTATVPDPLTKIGINGMGNVLIDSLVEVQTQTQAQAVLQKLLAQKGQQLQQLLQVYTTTVQQVYDALSIKNTGRNIVLWSLGGLALLGLTWYLISELQPKEK